MTARAALLAACALSCALACSKKAANLCAADAQCQPGFACDPLTGACRCAADSSCGKAEMCNAAGFCQPRLNCDSTADCAPGSLCDTRSGVCIAAGACNALDVQCKGAEVCRDFSCVPGCAHDGDCAAPADVCRPCPAGTPAAQCPVGKLCVRGKCDSKLTCRYGDLCSPDGAGDTVCAPDTRGPYCLPCARAAGSATYCPDETGHGNGNYCLIDPSKPLGQGFFCGVDCSGGQECPFGYFCKDIRIVTAQVCKPEQGLSACANHPTTVQCDPARTHAGPSGIGGLVNDDCEAAIPSLTGSVCDPGTHRCVPQCLGTGETGVTAFCGCVVDGDCPQDQCDSSKRACLISGRACNPALEQDECQTTHAIRCVQSNDARLGKVGTCRIGQNCAPNQGYTCSILLSGSH